MGLLACRHHRQLDTRKDSGYSVGHKISGRPLTFTWTLVLPWAVFLAGAQLFESLRRAWQTQQTLEQFQFHFHFRDMITDNLNSYQDEDNAAYEENILIPVASALYGGRFLGPCDFFLYLIYCIVWNIGGSDTVSDSIPTMKSSVSGWLSLRQ